MKIPGMQFLEGTLSSESALPMGAGRLSVLEASEQGHVKGSFPAPEALQEAIDTFAPNPYHQAIIQAERWQNAKPETTALLQKIGSVPTAYWLDGHASDVRAAVSSYMETATRDQKMPVLALYNIPERDRGEHSQGGLNEATLYDNWINQVITGLGDKPAMILLEPDSLAQLDRFSPEERTERTQMLARAAAAFATKSAAKVYLDGGHPGWHSAEIMAERLHDAGVEHVAGFSLNVSNFQTTASNIAYGREISRQLGGKSFVIDTGRNGNGPSPTFEWCNPSGRALGELPTLHTNEPLVDAYLWVKVPGESDGTEGQPINGTPPPIPGDWWPEYALQLAENAGW